MASESMGSIGALDDGAELWVADARFASRRTHRARADAHLDDVGTWQDQFLHHLTRHHVTCLKHTYHTSKIKYYLTTASANISSFFFFFKE